MPANEAKEIAPDAFIFGMPNVYSAPKAPAGQKSNWILTR
jgi:hypothetical protein